MAVLVNKYKIEDENQKLVKQISNELGVQKTIAKLLVARGVDSVDKAYQFLFPNLVAYSNPLELPQLDYAVARIKKGIANGEKIAIYGDYDVDGVTATTILMKALKQAGAKAVLPYIPSRKTDGYGMNMRRVKAITKQDVSLIITVDCGITNHEEIAYCKEQQIDVIVTDHHKIQEPLTSAYSVTNPVVLEDKHPMRNLSGAGVAFKLAQALLGEDESNYLVQYAAIGTVADIVSLTDENRTIVFNGLLQINQNCEAGISQLIKNARLNNKQITSDSIAFGLAPRINAAGRMSSAYLALNLFTNPTKMSQLGKRIESLNNERKKATDETFEQAEQFILKEGDIFKPTMLIAYGNWNAGVIGIAASRLVEKYHRPVVLFSTQDDKLVGSARSIDGLDVYSILKRNQALFLHFGGHSAAAGLTILKKDFNHFKNSIKKHIKNLENKTCFGQIFNYDIDLTDELFGIDELEQIERLQPFGKANEAPSYIIREAKIKDTRSIGEKKNHLSFTIYNNESQTSAVFFNCNKKQYDFLTECNNISLIGKLSINEWNSLKNVQFLTERFFGINYDKVFNSTLNRNDFVLIYKWLKAQGNELKAADYLVLYGRFLAETQENLEIIKFQAAINILNEANLIEIRRQNHIIIIELKNVKEKVDLFSTVNYMEFIEYNQLV